MATTKTSPSVAMADRHERVWGVWVVWSPFIPPCWCRVHDPTGPRRDFIGTYDEALDKLARCVTEHPTTRYEVRRYTGKGDGDG